jgi:hypothetical protein
VHFIQNYSSDHPMFLKVKNKCEKLDFDFPVENRRVCPEIVKDSQYAPFEIIIASSEKESESNFALK